MGSVGCGLKAVHGNIMDVLEEKKNLFFFFVLSDLSLSLLPKQLISYLLKEFSFVCNGKVIRLCFVFFFF